MSAITSVSTGLVLLLDNMFSTIELSFVLSSMLFTRDWLMSLNDVLSFNKILRSSPYMLELEWCLACFSFIIVFLFSGFISDRSYIFDKLVINGKSRINRTEVLDMAWLSLTAIILLEVSTLAFMMMSHSSLSSCSSLSI